MTRLLLRAVVAAALVYAATGCAAQAPAPRSALCVEGQSAFTVPPMHQRVTRSVDCTAKP
jgi:hypothetical protein